MTTATLPRSGAATELSMSGEFVAAAGTATVAMGERFHLYEAMAEAESVSITELADATDTPLWFVEGWLYAQVKAGYVAFDPITHRYSLFCSL